MARTTKRRDLRRPLLAALVIGWLALGLGAGSPAETAGATDRATAGWAVQAASGEATTASAGEATPNAVATSGAADVQIVSRAATDEKVVALTFDAGSDAGHTMVILDILDAADVKATFFLTAGWLERYPELGQAVAERGHCLGNHTATHPHLTTLTDDEVRAELSVTEEWAQTVCGQTTRPFFRPPFGEYDDRVAKVAGEEGYGYLVLWTVDSLDWKMISAQELTQRIVDNVRPGAIILMHVGSQTNEPEALPETIVQLKALGYRFDRLSELLLEEPPSSATYYTVRAGDTLWSVAKRFGVRLDDIVRVNGLPSADDIKIGQTLLIPDPGSADGDGGEGNSGGGGEGNGDSHEGGAGGDDGANGDGGTGDEGRGEDGPCPEGGFWTWLWSGLGRVWLRLCGFVARVLGR